MIRIGDRAIDTNVILAPMSGCSDLPFRLIAREHGAKFAFLEMLDANSFFHGSRRTFAMMKTTAKDTPIAAQIVGAEPEVMLGAARRILETIPRVTFLDINAACPVKKVIKKKSGAYLLRDSTTLFRIVDLLVKSLPVPVTIKLRLGYQDETVDDIVDIVKRCQDLGVAAFFVHGRTRLQFYAGDVDYAAIRAIKAASRVPVIGSGNVLSPQLARTMLEKTGCDGILVARGAFGNPWIFSDIETHLETGRLPARRSLEEKRSVLRRHIDYIQELNGSRGKIGVMRKVALWYLKYFPSARKLRGDISIVKTYGQMLQFIDRMRDPVPSTAEIGA